MRITIPESEIHQAIIDYIAGQGFDFRGKTVIVDLKATRGEAGFTADIDITDEGAVAVEAPAPTQAVAAKATATVTKRAPLAAVKADPEPEVEEIKATEPEATDDSEDTAEDAAPAEKPKSLFGNMTKPVNA